MADSAKWATAAEPIEEKGTFLRAYQDNRQSAIEASLEGSPVATVLREMVKEVLHWEGAASELLNLLWQRADERTKMQRSWPKSAKGLGGQLRRLATALRATGIDIKHKRADKGATCIIHIKTACKDSSNPSAASASEQEQTLTADEWLAQVDMADASPTNADAYENELSHCSTNIADATDANLLPYSKTRFSQWTKPTFQIIPNPPDGARWHKLYPPYSTTIDGGMWSTRI